MKRSEADKQLLLFMNMEKMIGKDFENGLAKLKTLLEQQDDY